MTDDPIDGDDCNGVRGGQGRTGADLVGTAMVLLFLLGVLVGWILGVIPWWRA